LIFGNTLKYIEIKKYFNVFQHYIYVFQFQQHIKCLPKYYNNAPQKFHTIISLYNYNVSFQTEWADTENT
jgi:hypothetical protein